MAITCSSASVTKNRGSGRELEVVFLQRRSRRIAAADAIDNSREATIREGFHRPGRPGRGWSTQFAGATLGPKIRDYMALTKEKTGEPSASKSARSKGSTVEQLLSPWE